jgi:hypothetical protein
MTTAATTLLDEVLPEFDFESWHARRVAAPPERVAEAVDGYRLGGGASLLVRIRGLHVPAGSIRDVLANSGFTMLAERPGVEWVAGTNGQFWALCEQAHMEAPRDLRAFRAFDRPGWAQGAMSIRIESRGRFSAQLITETRVRCIDDEARSRFAIYWAFIKVFSGWLRRDFLRKVARTAEGSE